MLILSLEMTSEGDPVLLEKELAKYRRLRQLVEIQK